MAGMTEREVGRQKWTGGSALYQVRGKTLLHDDWLAKAASRIRGLRCDAMPWPMGQDRCGQESVSRSSG
jgi:hypothetical protein